MLGDRFGARLAGLAAVATALVLAARADAQQPAEFGHKTLGAIGLGAGSQPDEGISVASKFVFYRASELVDRHGDVVPVGLDLDAFANAFGVGTTFELAPLSTYLNASIAVPIATLSVNTDRPEASVDREGFGDLYVQPLKLGWRFPRADAVVGYALYVPTGKPASKGGIGAGQVTHEGSLGGTVYFDEAKRWQLSALASYDVNQPKEHTAITRGDTIQIQGGFGAAVIDIVDAGLAGYALWQVSDDRGSALPALLQGGRDRVFGVGPEISVRIPQIRGELTTRYEHDLTVKSRALGQVLVVAVSIQAFAPR